MRRMRFVSLLDERAVTAFAITAQPRQLSVTESVCAPALTRKGGHMSDIRRFDLREWLVPPVLVPLFFALAIAAVVVLQPYRVP